jgi:flagellar biosynthetic protein FlhB
MAEDLGERTEMPTSRRLREARDRGQIAKSQDLGVVLALIGAAIVLAMMGWHLFDTLGGLTRQLLSWNGDDPMTAFGSSKDWVASTVLWTGGELLLVLLPMLFALGLVNLLSQFVQVGPLLSTTLLAPKLDRLNPVSGLSRLFSRRSVARAIGDALKVSALAIVGCFLVIGAIQQLPGLHALDVLAGVSVLARLVAKTVAIILVVMLIISLLDYWFQRWQHTRDLKMTKQEVKDEHRSMEGDPEVKGRRLRMAREMVTQRIRQRVPTADVVVTNPTHFAVALKYEDDMIAPVVVAKGADYLALRIREIAAASNVPIIERPPLARALYHTVDLDRPVPSSLYAAVAEVLAFAYRLQHDAA